MKNKYNLNKLLIASFFLIASIVINYPLISHKFPTTIDFSFHYLRIIGMAKSMDAGHVPMINTAYLNGLGYPVDLFYPNFFLLPIAWLITKGFTLSLLLKIYYVISTFLCFLAMYIAVKKITKKRSISIISSIIYTTSFYRFQDLYYRVGLGTTTMYIFIPLIILGFYLIMYKNDKEGSKWLVIGMTGLILSHIISTVLSVILLLVWYICLFKKWTLFSLKQFLISASHTLLLTAFFLMPMIEQMFSYEYYAKKHPVYMIEDSAPKILNLIKDNFRLDPLSKNMVSIAIFLVIILRLILINSKKDQLFKLADVSALIGLLMVIFSTSLIPWKIIHSMLPFVNVIQFTNRFIPFALPFLSLASGIYIVLVSSSKLFNRFSELFLILVSIFIVVTSGRYVKNLMPYSMRSLNGMYLISTYNIGGGHEYLPADTNFEFIEKYEDPKKIPDLIADNSTNLKNFKLTRKDTDVHIQGTMKKKGKLIIPLLYYKGYTATNNGNPIHIFPGKEHLITMNLPKGHFEVLVMYTGTKIQKVSRIISFGTVLITIIVVLQGILKKSSNDIFYLKKKNI